jgi:hypothetical protein
MKNTPGEPDRLRQQQDSARRLPRRPTLGTGMPELAGSIISVLKNEHDLAIGNLIGSDLLDLLAMLVVRGAPVS